MASLGKASWRLARNFNSLFSEPLQTLENMLNFKHMSGPMDINGTANVPKAKCVSSAMLARGQRLKILQDQGLAEEQRAKRETKIREPELLSRPLASVLCGSKPQDKAFIYSKS